MPRYIIKIKDKYLEWSTIVDAPVTYGMTLEQFKEFYEDEYGRTGMTDLNDRLARVDKNGTSSRMGESVEDMIRGNRAGPKETPLTLDEIYEQFCKKDFDEDG